MIDFSPLAGVVAAFAEAAPLGVLRASEVDQVNLRRVEGPRTPVDGIRGSCWPVPPARLAQLDQGKRLAGWLDAFTLQPLQIADDRNGQPGDFVVRPNGTYEVVQQHEWSRAPLYAYLLQMVKRGAT